MGQRRANAWGLHDMLENVWEWTGDWYGGYPTRSATDSGDPSTGSGRQLERLREVRSIHDSGHRLARHALPIRRLPLGQDRLILLGCSREMICGDCPEH